jgi:hypothetical protein
MGYARRCRYGRLEEGLHISWISVANLEKGHICENGIINERHVKKIRTFHAEKVLPVGDLGGILLLGG